MAVTTYMVWTLWSRLILVNGRNGWSISPPWKNEKKKNLFVNAWNVNNKFDWKGWGGGWITNNWYHNFIRKNNSSSSRGFIITHLITWYRTQTKNSTSSREREKEREVVMVFNRIFSYKLSMYRMSSTIMAANETYK